MKKCPHCGGENGYVHKSICEFRSFYLWDGSHNESECGDDVYSGKRYHCCDCGKIVKPVTPE